MRGFTALLSVFAFALAGCGATGGTAREESSVAEERPLSVSSAVTSCTERILERIPEEEREEARRYVEVTYCARFAERGWVYEDGTLSIEAFKWFEEGGKEECAEMEAVPEGQPPKPARTVPCEKLDYVEGGNAVIEDCSPLLYVRRSDVREYVEQLRRRHDDVECEDGTPLAELGAP